VIVGLALPFVPWPMSSPFLISKASIIIKALLSITFPNYFKNVALDILLSSYELRDVNSLMLTIKKKFYHQKQKPDIHPYNVSTTYVALNVFPNSTAWTCPLQEDVCPLPLQHAPPVSTCVLSLSLYDYFLLSSSFSYPNATSFPGFPANLLSP
jgi:hypothetical protein